MARQAPNLVYIRRIASTHDLKKEINIGKPALNTFFEGNTHITFIRKNDKNRIFNIDINSSGDDPRFGNQIEPLLNEEGGYEIGDLFVIYKINSTDYEVELIKKNNPSFSILNKVYDDSNANERHTIISIDKNDDEDLPLFNENKGDDDKTEPMQIIMYGVPGSGKSYSINKKLGDLKIIKYDTNNKIIENYKTERTKRIVFHPEYTNSDFIGQIMPQLVKDESGKEIIKYEFVEGPFTEIVKKAYLDKDNNYALIIEEINRGNAAAIFGELFQLLDRFEDKETETINGFTYDAGWSSYCINNDFINREILEGYSDTQLCKAPYIEKEIFENSGLNIGIRLPPNLSLFATMNTSDQNVFKLDNAFKRRWNLQLIPNEFVGNLTDLQKNQRDATIEGFGISWETFRSKVNECIKDPKYGYDSYSFSDKQLGIWFVKNKNGKITKEDFAYKVIEYLWDDVFTDNLTIFNKDYKTLADIIDAIINNSKNDIFDIPGLEIPPSGKNDNE